MFYEPPQGQPKSTWPQSRGEIHCKHLSPGPWKAQKLFQKQLICLVYPIHFLSWNRFDNSLRLSWYVCNLLISHYHLRGILPSIYSIKVHIHINISLSWCFKTQQLCHIMLGQTSHLQACDFILSWKSSPKTYFSAFSSSVLFPEKYSWISVFLNTGNFLICRKRWSS